MDYMEGSQYGPYMAQYPLEASLTESAQREFLTRRKFAVT